MTMMSIDAVLPWIGGIGIFVSEKVVVSPATTGSVVGVGGAGFATADGLAATAADGDAAGEAAADAAGLQPAKAKQPLMRWEPRPAWALAPSWVAARWSQQAAGQAGRTRPAQATPDRSTPDSRWEEVTSRTDSSRCGGGCGTFIESYPPCVCFPRP